MVKPSRRWCGGALLPLLVFVAAPSAARAQTAAGSAEKGSRLFAEYYCYACHGTMGQGGSAGARIAPRPITFAAFETYLRRPTGQMPPYTRRVASDQDLADLYAYLRAVPAVKRAGDIPLLAR